MALSGSDGSLTNLHILDNHVYANTIGINVGGGACGATGNMVEAEIARNTLSGNGSALTRWGGTNDRLYWRALSPPRRTT